ncbi:MAG: type II toxin-antitoxin system Phd/YefM family antitoxin [Proteobacteria bacterium]|nr:type II toxin-antitoxin system Phd/YefM family antitoxin [Pseudomonadota bacterium]
MPMKFSEEIVPLSDLKANPGKFVSRANKNKRPILLTSRGRGVAVIQGLEEFENMQEERGFMQAITQGLLEIKEGKEQSLDDIKEKLGL